MTEDIKNAIAEKMKNAGMSEVFISQFLVYVDKVYNGEKGLVDWSTVHDMDENEDFIRYENLMQKYSDRSDLTSLAVIKLNGGLGTSMGLDLPKSLIEVKPGFSFLAVIREQIKWLKDKYRMDIPLLLMDSFTTQEPSVRELERDGLKQDFPFSFLQHRVPRLNKETLLPFTHSDEAQEWCPPGHGDLFHSLLDTGILDKLLEKKYEYAFISNGDNLGASVEPAILAWLRDEKVDFAMEMTPKTRADKKGGTLYRKDEEGGHHHLELLEVAQVPEEHMDDFVGDKFSFFNTNNLWVNLAALKKLLTEDRLSLSLIVNPKEVDGTDILQLETAMGSAIGSFENARGIIVPRTRFSPVKKCEDYLVRRSDAYILNGDYTLEMNPERVKAGLGEVVIHLDDRYYKKLKSFECLFSEIPSLLYCSLLEVKGEVDFDIPVEIRGKVVINNNSGRTAPISSLGKTVFSDETVDF